jgi:diguanylate cyclase (GGDEF)-like protein
MPESLILVAIGVWTVTVAWRSDARRRGVRGAASLLTAIAALASADVVASVTGDAGTRAEAAAAVLVVVANGVLLWAVHEVMRPSPARMRAHMFDALVLGSAAIVVLLAPLGERLASMDALRFAGAVSAAVLLIAGIVLLADAYARTTTARQLLVAALFARAADEIMRASGQIVGLFTVVTYCTIILALWHLTDVVRPAPRALRPEMARVVLVACALTAAVVGLAFQHEGRAGVETAVVVAAAVFLVALTGGRFAWTVRMSTDARVELAHRAAHDTLTGLANRPLLADRLVHALARAQRSDGSLAVLSIDLARFKAVNDTWGHSAGDAVLVEVAQRLTQLVRPGDTVARVGGDEFVVVCEGLDDVEDAIAVAERVVDAVSPPIGVASSSVAISVCVGIAIHSDEQSTPETLLRDAEAAMFMAKREGPNRWELFDAQLREQVHRRRDTEVALQGALERDELRLMYQPIVRLATGDITGFEALVRWARPGVGLVGPGEFIELAEETHLIHEIGAWVFEQAARQVALWNSQHPDRAPLTISVNVSPRQFGHPGFVERLERIIRRTGVDPQSLLLEITESVLVSGADQGLALLENIKRLGLRLAIDDFGTGYSALAYLRQFPVDVVKIDRVFMEELGRLAVDTTVVAAIIRLAQVLGQQVIAEGAETAPQMAALYELGCDFVQGFYFAPPLAQAQAEMLVRGRRDLASVRTALQRA